MAVIDLGKFGPVYFDGRRVDLPPEASLGIVNVRLGGEKLEASRVPAPVNNVWQIIGPSIFSRPYIYRTGTHSNDDARIWAFPANTDIARSPTQGDWEDRIVLTDWTRFDTDTLAPPSYAPKTVSKTIAQATDPDSLFPYDFRYLGVPAPSLAPALTGVLPNTAVIISFLKVDAIMLFRTYKNIPDWTAAGAPGDGDTLIEVLDTDDGEHIYGGFIPGQRMVVVEIFDENTVRIAAPNADRAIGDLNDSYKWYFDKADAGTQLILTWRLPKTAIATIENHDLQVNDVLRVTQVTVNPEWFSTDTLTLSPSIGMERIAVPPNSATPITAGNFVVGVTYKIVLTGTTDFTLIGAEDSDPGTWFIATGVGTGTGTAVEAIGFTGQVSCVVEPPGLPVVYDNDGLFAVGAAPNPLVITANSYTSGGTAAAPCTATPIAGIAPYTYAWSWLSGGTGLVLANTSSPTVTVSRTYTQGETQSYGGVLRCTVTDDVATVAATDVTVSVSIDGSAPPPIPGGLTVTITPSNPANYTQDTSGGAGTFTSPAFTVSATLNGSPVNLATSSIVWAWSVGGTNMTIDTPSASSTTWSSSYTLDLVATRTGTLSCTVTDQYGNSGSATSTTGVELGSTNGPDVTLSTSLLFDSRSTALSAGSVVKTVTATPNAGVGPYTYSWFLTDEIYAGGGSVVLSNDTTATVTVTFAYTKGQTYEANFTLNCTVTDTGTGIPQTVSVDGIFIGDGSGGFF